MSKLGTRHYTLSELGTSVDDDGGWRREEILILRLLLPKKYYEGMCEFFVFLNE